MQASHRNTRGHVIFSAAVRLAHGTFLQPAATFRDMPGSENMHTFAKILLFALIALLVAHFWPLALFPLLLVGGVMLVLGAAAAGTVGIVLSIVVGLLGALLGLVCTAAAVLSPIWIPLALILGIVWLARRASRPAGV